DGYTFIGWKDEDGNVYGPNDNYKVEDNETLTAVWGATVTYDPAGGSVNPASEVKASGETVTLPTPTRSGYTFKGWDLNGQTYQAGDQYTVDGDVTFTAQWEQNNDLPPYVPDNPPAPAEPDVIVIPVDPDVDADGSGEKNDDGTITITVKDGDGEPLDPVPGGIFVQVKNAEDGDVVVIIDPETGEILDLVEKSLVENGTAYALLDGPATIKIIRNAKPFDDVHAGDWFDGAVKFVSSHELFLGITEDLFAPGYEMTRGMLVTVLWRLENRPEAAGNMAFDDVEDGAYYAEAVNWAAENGLVNGYGDGTFRPNRSITREEMAALLHRYMNYLGYEFTPVDSLDAFSDGDTVSAWAVDDVKWAVGAGMIAGRPDGTIDPQGTANRAEVATMFMRFISAMVKSHAV
ncbi:MAG: S-layer homology domain-containing protein, partial [Oscillospiraceae bacterium]|nr:S-layer homology domain-containing protein [Oscillospiraceae bacterium]